MTDPTKIDEALEDADTTALLASILAEQQAQTRLLASLAGEAVPRDPGGPDAAESGEKERLYRCDICDAEVPASERSAHLVDRHNSPPKPDLGPAFTPLDDLEDPEALRDAGAQ